MTILVDFFKVVYKICFKIVVGSYRGEELGKDIKISI